MNRKLPLVDILGTAFFVDVLHERLQQQDNPGNRIPFDVFEQDRDGYTFLYDRLRKNVPDEIEFNELDERFIRVTLPALMELDPEGIALKYHIPLEILCPEKHGVCDAEDEDVFYDEGLFG
jgi:hypothetical protein